MDEIKPLAPGSQEAIDAGCICPIMDNGYGRGSGYKTEDGQPVFWYNFDCPIHGKAIPIDDEKTLLKDI